MRSGESAASGSEVNIQRRIAWPALGQRLFQRIGCTSSARLVLTNSACGMRARSSAVTMPRVASFRRRCRLSTSACSKKASREAAAT
jgi:hypothetical protein